MKTLRSVILAVAAVAVVGTTLSSPANAGQYIGKFDYGTTAPPIPQWARHLRCGYGWGSYHGKCYMK
jgi:hypothetical protein